MKYVQYSDKTKTEIIVAFSCPQDGEAYPNQGVVEDEDPLYLAFIARFETAS